MGDRRGWLKALGPGLLFAAVSVGVSHLVQSTRAGAGYGFTLIWIVLLALVLKYPLFEFGQRYAAGTGTSLLEGYRRQGRWSLVLYLLLTVGSMFTVLAAVGAVTAGLAMQLTAVSFGSVPTTVSIWTGLIILLAGALLLVGRYPLLDKAIKVIMGVLAVSALAAMVMALPQLWKSGAPVFGSMDWSSVVQVTFVVGLVGWMPTGMDVSVWQSFWMLARRRQTGYSPTLRETLFDFRAGYLGTCVLAVIFCLLGTAVMFVHGVEIPADIKANQFAALVVSLFTKTLGDWSRPVILVAAFTTMFSTTLTVLDGFPRALQLLGRRFRSPESPDDVVTKMARCRGYWVWMGILTAGAMLIVVFYLKGLGNLVDLATVLSFITAPFLGILTYRAIMGREVPDEYRPGRLLRGLALVGIGFLGAFLLYFAYVRIFMD